MYCFTTKMPPTFYLYLPSFFSLLKLLQLNNITAQFKWVFVHMQQSSAVVEGVVNQHCSKTVFSTHSDSVFNNVMIIFNWMKYSFP